MLYFVMKQDRSMVCGWRLCGTTSTPAGARNLQDAHTTFLNGKPFIVPQIWDEAKYSRWQEESPLTQHRS